MTRKYTWQLHIYEGAWEINFVEGTHMVHDVTAADDTIGRAIIDAFLAGQPDLAARRENLKFDLMLTEVWGLWDA